MIYREQYIKFQKNIISIKRHLKKDKLREMAVIYDKLDNQVNIITIHPLKIYQKLSRIKSGRWQKL